jgi:hypothetical protein
MTIFARTDRRLALAGLISLAAAVPGAAQTAPARCGLNLPPPPSVPPVTAPEICATIATLADDSMEGRRAGTEAADRAAAWIAGRFEAIGLSPERGRLPAPFTFPKRSFAILMPPRRVAGAPARNPGPPPTCPRRNVAGSFAAPIPRWRTGRS